jgi:carbonic anhydrase
MTQYANEFDAYAFSKQPGYDERVVRREFAKAVPLRTVVVYCYDPRAVGIPRAVAEEFGDVFPGTIVRDDGGKKVASTTTLFEVVVAGGRAIDALRSVTVAQHLFGIERVVIVHHTYCGATSFTARGIIDAYAREQGTDIGSLYARDSICITDYASSLTHDVRQMRTSAGTPRQAAIYGYLYDIDAEALSLVVEDKPGSVQQSLLSSSGS